MSRSFFVTGGTGLIGRAFVRNLLRRRDDIGLTDLLLLTRNVERFASLAPDIVSNDVVRLLEGDIATVALPENRFTDMVHAATDVNDLTIQDRYGYVLNIVAGTQRTLQYAEKVGCERYLYFSSGAVYGAGDYPSTGIPESWLLAPELGSTGTGYGQAKRFSEHLCALYAEKCPLALRIARIFSVVGPESPLDGQFALGNFVRNAIDPTVDVIRVNGDGTPTRSYLHVNDAADWLFQIHERAPDRATYNVGSAREVSIKELAELVATLAPTPKAVRVEKSDEVTTRRHRYFPDCSLVRNQLGLQESISLESAIVELTVRRSVKDH